LADVFTGWVKALPCSSEKAQEVIKVLINEVIPRFELPWTLQSDNGWPSEPKSPRGSLRLWESNTTSTVPGDPNHLANGLLKRHLSKLTQETHLPWPRLLLLALTQLRNTPNSLGLTPFEALYGRPFLQNDLLLDTNTANLMSHTTQIAKFQQILSELGRDKPREDSSTLFCPGDMVLS
jgi:hypothetical protein